MNWLFKNQFHESELDAGDGTRERITIQMAALFWPIVLINFIIRFVGIKQFVVEKVDKNRAT